MHIASVVHSDLQALKVDISMVNGTIKSQIPLSSFRAIILESRYAAG